MKRAALAVPIKASPPEARQPEAEPDRHSRLWLATATVVAGLHAGVLAAAVLWQPEHVPSLPPAMGAMMIDLAPAVAPPTPAVVPTAEPPQPPTRPPVPERPKPPPVKKAVVALPRPMPQVMTPPTIEAAPVETINDNSAAAPSAALPAAPVSTAPSASPVAAPSGDAVYSWQGALRAHLERHKRYPSVAQFRRQQGVPVLRVVMDREGRVLSAQLERTGGHEALDTEALALLTRAQPLPVPPPDVVGNQIELKVPVQFFLR